MSASNKKYYNTECSVSLETVIRLKLGLINDNNMM